MADTVEALQGRLAKARADRKAAEASENERLDSEWKARGLATLQAQVEKEEASVSSFRKSTQAQAPAHAPTPPSRPRPSSDEE